MAEPTPERQNSLRFLFGSDFIMLTEACKAHGFCVHCLNSANIREQGQLDFGTFTTRLDMDDEKFCLMLSIGNLPRNES